MDQLSWTSREAAVDDSSQSNLDLVRRFVDEGLNGGHVGVVDELFAMSFRDHDPLLAPGLEPNIPGIGTIRDLRRIVEFLSSPSVDMAFVLEDMFATHDRIAYRLFGEGTVGPLTRFARNPNDKDPTQAPLSRLSFSIQESDASLTANRQGAVPRNQQHVIAFPEGKVLGGRIHWEYRCVGIYRASCGRLVERWGQMVLR